jgi:tRNA-splicing ligase RtcB
MQVIDGINVWAANNEPDEAAIAQMRNVSYVGNVAGTALMADHHKGYSQPIGGVVAYRDAVSPSGVGYDIGCGVKAVETDLYYTDLWDEDEWQKIGHGKTNVKGIADRIAQEVNFGLGGRQAVQVDHDLFDDPTWDDVKWIGYLKDKKARPQLGTVGSGNHYVDLLFDPMTDKVWVAAHFGSRGFGHTVASGFLNLAKFAGWSEHFKDDGMDVNPTLIEKGTNEYLFDAYIAAMNLAGRYAYAGRDIVVQQVLDILGAKEVDSVHSHHNFAWLEEHGGEKVWVVRKGATPAFPGQRGFVGGSMGDRAAIVEGVDTPAAASAFNSTIHGAGRIMSRSMAKGNRKGTKKGIVSREMMSKATKDFGVLVRGGDVDESPHVYRKLDGVLEAHSDSIAVERRLKPFVVVMAGADIKDPYRD